MKQKNATGIPGRTHGSIPWVGNCFQTRGGFRTPSSPFFLSSPNPVRLFGRCRLPFVSIFMEESNHVVPLPRPPRWTFSVCRDVDGRFPTRFSLFFGTNLFMETIFPHPLLHICIPFGYAVWTLLLRVEVINSTRLQMMPRIVQKTSHCEPSFPTDRRHYGQDPSTWHLVYRISSVHGEPIKKMGIPHMPTVKGQCSLKNPLITVHLKKIAAMNASIDMFHKIQRSFLSKP